MADTTTGIITPNENATDLNHVPAGAVKIPAGVLVSTGVSGYAQNAGDDANTYFEGIAAKECDNSAGAAGDLEVVIFTNGLHEFTFSALALSSVGRPAYAVDNQKLALSGANKLFCGIVARYISATKGMVDIAPAMATQKT